MGVKLSEMTDDTVVDGSEEVLALDGTQTKTIATSLLASYTIDVLSGATDQSPVSGDKFAAFRSGTEQLLSLDDVSDYAIARGWSAASEANPAVSGDMILADRGGTKYEIDVDTLATYINSGQQAAALDISGLSVATLGATDQLLVVQGSTAKKTTLSELETQLWSDFATYVQSLGAIASLESADVVYALDAGSTPKYTTVGDITDYVLANLNDVWDTSTTTTTPADDDVYVFERSGSRYNVTAEYLADYVIAEFGAESAVVAAADGDKLAMWRSGSAGTLTVDLLATYVQATILDDFATQTSLNDSDTILFGRSGSGNQVTAANLQSYVLSGVQADVLDISGLTSATLNTTDEILVNQSGVAKKTTISALETQLWSDFATYVAGLTDISSVADADKFYVLDGGSTPKYATAAQLVTYITTEQWAASAAASVSSGDTLLIDSGGTRYEATVDQLQTFVLAGGQSSILDLSGLSDATGVAGTDHLLLSQSGTPAKIDLDDVASEVHDRIASWVSGLGEATDVLDTDLVYVHQSGSKYVTAANLANYFVAKAIDLPWQEIATAKYTATPASTSQITMSDTSDVAIGDPVKYTYGGTTYYGIVTALSANASITIAGAPLDVADPLTALYVGTPDMVREEKITISGAYAASVRDILANVGKQYRRWGLGDAYLVAIAATHDTADTGASQPKLNVKIAGSLVSTEDTSNGLQLSATPGTWVDGSAVAIESANYQISRGDSLEVRVTAAGSNGDASDLSLSCVFVLQ